MKLIQCFLLASLLFLLACNGIIKNDNPKIIEEEGTKVSAAMEAKAIEDFRGIYVGMFEPILTEEESGAKNIFAGEAFYWRRENKISIFIDELKDSEVKGHSVVAGNNTLFEGVAKKNGSGFFVEAKEIGNNKNDGAFTFFIKDSLLDGTWKSFKKIDIENRKYTLIKTVFVYNANQMLDSGAYHNRSDKYVDWTKPEMGAIEIKQLKSKMSKTEVEEYEEFEENTSFSSATDGIYDINASTQKLSELSVSNLSKGDLTIIRNCIYARHGYSFKYMPLRVFFNKQNWYMPISNDIRASLTDIEKQNIILLLKYEKVAKEYYDYFGRG